MWRAISLLVLAFWLVMTTLLVRYTWYPEGSQFAEVPPRVVLQRFMEEGKSLSSLSTLHIYHREKKIGHANLSSRGLRLALPGSGQDYALHITANLDKGAVKDIADSITCDFDLKLLKLETFGGMKGRIRLNESGTILDFLWAEGEAIPTFTLKRRGELLADDQAVKPMVAMMLGNGQAAGIANGLGIPPGSDEAGLLQVKARESTMSFAGQKRLGYSLDFTVLEHWKARAFFTEAGELALVDLPEGFRLVEPVIHGLAPDYDADDEEE